MCAEQRLELALAPMHSDQSFHCLHEKFNTLYTLLAKMLPEKILIRLRMRRLILIFAGRTYPKVRFFDVVAHMIVSQQLIGTIFVPVGSCSGICQERLSHTIREAYGGKYCLVSVSSLTAR